MSTNKWTRANRLTEVIRHEIVTETVGSSLGCSKETLAFHGDQFRNLDDGDTIWWVWLTTRTGWDKESIRIAISATEDDAKEAVNSLPVGTVFGDDIRFPFSFKELCDGAPTTTHAHKLLSMMFGMGDEDAVHFTCYDALSNAGVICEKTYQISQQVLDWLGAENVDWMKAEFGENWSSVGELEYCLRAPRKIALPLLTGYCFWGVSQLGV